METRILSALKERAPLTDPLLKTTALFYLRDALEKERYEECADLLESARGYGASPREINSALAQAVRKLGANPAGAGAFRARMFS